MTFSALICMLSLMVLEIQTGYAQYNSETPSTASTEDGYYQKPGKPQFQHGHINHHHHQHNQHHQHHHHQRPSRPEKPRPTRPSYPSHGIYGSTITPLLPQTPTYPGISLPLPRPPPPRPASLPPRPPPPHYWPSSPYPYYDPYYYQYYSSGETPKLPTLDGFYQLLELCRYHNFNCTTNFYPRNWFGTAKNHDEIFNPADAEESRSDTAGSAVQKEVINVEQDTFADPTAAETPLVDVEPIFITAPSTANDLNEAIADENNDNDARATNIDDTTQEITARNSKTLNDVNKIQVNDRLWLQERARNIKIPSTIVYNKDNRNALVRERVAAAYFRDSLANAKK